MAFTLESMRILKRIDGVVHAGLRDEELLRAAGADLGVKFDVRMSGAEIVIGVMTSPLPGDGWCGAGAKGVDVSEVLGRLMPKLRARLGKAVSA